MRQKWMCLFWYTNGQTTADFTNMSYPSNVVTLGDFDAAQLNAAAQQCTNEGVVPGPQFDACELDVVETGDASYAAAAAAVTNYLVAPGSATVDTSGNLSEDFDGAIPVNLKPNSLWNPTADPSTGAAGSQAVGPILDSGGYTFSVPSLPAHDTINLTPLLAARPGATARSPDGRGHRQVRSSAPAKSSRIPIQPLTAGRSVTTKNTRTVTDVLMQNCHRCPETSHRLNMFAQVR